MNGELENTEREIGVDLLKIIASFLVILCHYVQTVRNDVNILVEYNAVFDGFRSTFTMLDGYLLYFFRSFGHIGNSMFAVSSAWYLCSSKKTKLNKDLQLLLDAFVISILFLFTYLSIYENIPSKYIVNSIFPNLFANNWYISAYAMLYAFHSGLNLFSEYLSKANFFRICFGLFFIYYIVVYLSGQSLLYLTNYLCLILIYLFVSYIKKYNLDFCNNLKKQAALFIISVSTLLIAYYIDYCLIEFPFELYMLNNPLLLFIGFSSFNILRNIKVTRFKKSIVFVSSLSMFMYVIHENILFRNLTRVKIAYFMFEKLGTSFMTIKVILFAVMIFIGTVTASVIYKFTFHKVTDKIANYSADLINSFCSFILKRI